MRNLRMFEIDYLGATDTKGNRIKIKDLRHNKNIILARNYEIDTIEQAIQFLNTKEISCDFKSQDETKNNFYIFSNNFENQIK